MLPIKVGLGDVHTSPGLPAPKRQTIRASARAKPGDILQLYCRQRHPSGFLIGKARCTSVERIGFMFCGESAPGRERDILEVGDRRVGRVIDALDDFARADGFDDWAALRAFWAERHPGVTDFAGAITRWEPLP